MSFPLTVVCLTCKPDTQIILAQILSIIYALVMMAVLVGMLIQVTEDGILAPTTLTLLFITSVFILAAILHPQVRIIIKKQKCYITRLTR